MHFRHPYELGGLYFAFSLFSVHIVSFWLAFRYVRFTEENPEGLTIVLSQSTVYIVISGLTLAQFSVFFFMFLRWMDPAHRYTFYSTKTGNDNACDYFMLHDTDDKSYKSSTTTNKSGLDSLLKSPSGSRSGGRDGRRASLLGLRKRLR